MPEVPPERAGCAGTGITSAQLRDANTFSAWNISAAGGSSAVWRIYEGQTGPLLRSFMTDITIAVDDISSSYNGAQQAFNATYDAAGADTSLILSGSATYRNAGSYDLGGSLYSGQQGYDISYTGGTLDIARANLILSTGDVVKTYDGTTNADATAVAIGGTQLFGSDSVSGGVFAFAYRNAGAGNRVVTINGVSIDDGNGGANYNVSYVDNTTSTINRAELTVTGLVAADKIYDTTTAATLSGGVLSGVFGSDDVDMALQSASFADENAGADKLVTASIVIDGADAGNYVLASPAQTTASITRATMTITANDQIRWLGTANPELTLTYSGFVAGEDASVLTTRPTASTAANRTSPVGNYTITASGAVSQNYAFTYVPGTLIVTRAMLSAGYPETLSYVRDVGSDESPDAESKRLKRLQADSSLLQLRNLGIKLPTGVQ